MRDWLMQVRYPYTAGVIGVIWLGTALFSLSVEDVPIELLVIMSAFATLIVAAVGFASKR